MYIVTVDSSGVGSLMVSVKNVLEKMPQYGSIVLLFLVGISIIKFAIKGD